MADRGEFFVRFLCVPDTQENKSYFSQAVRTADTIFIHNTKCFRVLQWRRFGMQFDHNPGAKPVNNPDFDRQLPWENIPIAFYDGRGVGNDRLRRADERYYSYGVQIPKAHIEIFNVALQEDQAEADQNAIIIP